MRNEYGKNWTSQRQRIGDWRFQNCCISQSIQKCSNFESPNSLSYFGSVPFPSRTKVNSFGGTVDPVGALPGTAPGAGSGALGSGGSTVPWPPRKATYCFPSSI